MSRKFSLNNSIVLLLITYLAQKGIPFINSLMLGPWGSVALGAQALASGVFFMMLMFCWGTLSTVGPYIARAFGLQTQQALQETMLHGLFLALMLSFPCMCILYFSPNFFYLIGEDKNVVFQSEKLLQGYMWGFPSILGFLILIFFFR